MSRKMCDVVQGFRFFTLPDNQLRFSEHHLCRQAVHRGLPCYSPDRHFSVDSFHISDDALGRQTVHRDLHEVAVSPSARYYNAWQLSHCFVTTAPAPEYVASPLKNYTKDIIM